MRIGVFSDMHGNYVAFEAVLDDLKQAGVDRLVCLGDAVQGGPQPAQVVARLRELACPVVMGNADDWMLTGKETGADLIAEERLRKMNAVREWSLAQLSAEDQAFIAGFQPTVTVELNAAQNLVCFHGSPASYDDLIFPTTPEEDFQKMLGAYAAHILTGGHTHMQQLRRIADSFFFNPGSVGLAYSHQQPEGSFHTDPWAEYAILTADGGKISLEFRRVPFDVSRLIDVYHASGRPHADEVIAQYTR